MKRAITITTRFSAILDEASDAAVAAEKILSNLLNGVRP